MARDMDQSGRRDAGDRTESGAGRRIGRVPEPRPAPETLGKSVLLSRHRPEIHSAVASEVQAVGPEPEFETGEFTGNNDPDALPEPEFDREDLDQDLYAYADPEPDVRLNADVTDRDHSRRTLDPPRSGPQGRPSPDVRQQAPSHTPSPVVPSQSVAGRALMLVVGIMCFLACLAVGALVLVNDAARDWQLDVSREVTIQIKPVDGKQIEPMLEQAMSLARATQGVQSVRLMSERDSEGLLEPWLGSNFDYSKLPVPRLVLIELADPTSVDLKGLAQSLKATLPNAELDDHSIWTKRLRTMAGTMVAASVVVLFLVLTAMVLSVIFATRAAMAGNRDVVQVLHFVGAADSFIAGEFQHHFLILGFKGGIGGGLGAVLAFLLTGWVTGEANGLAAADQAHALFGGFSVGLNGYLGVAGIVLLVAGLTAVTSRLTVRSYLNQLD